MRRSLGCLEAGFLLVLLTLGVPSAGGVESQEPMVTEEDWRRMEAQLDAILKEQEAILESLERVIEEAKIVKIRASRRRP